MVVVTDDRYVVRHDKPTTPRNAPAWPCVTCVTCVMCMMCVMWVMWMIWMTWMMYVPCVLCGDEMREACVFWELRRVV